MTRKKCHCSQITRLCEILLEMHTLKYTHAWRDHFLLKQKEMKRKGNLAKRYTKYVSYNQCEICSLDKDFQRVSTSAMQTSTDTNPGFQWELHQEYLGILVWFELLQWSFLQKMALLVTGLIMKIQPYRNLLLIYYLKVRLNISILLIEWSFWTLFCALTLGIFLSLSPICIISRLLSFSILSERSSSQMHFSATTFA